MSPMFLHGALHGDLHSRLPKKPNIARGVQQKEGFHPAKCMVFAKKRPLENVIRFWVESKMRGACAGSKVP